MLVRRVKGISVAYACSYLSELLMGITRIGSQPGSLYCSGPPHVDTVLLQVKAILRTETIMARAF